MVTLSADLLLWLHAISEDTVHQEIELEKDDYDKDDFTNTSHSIPSSSGRVLYLGLNPQPCSWQATILQVFTLTLILHAWLESLAG